MFVCLARAQKRLNLVKYPKSILRKKKKKKKIEHTPNLCEKTNMLVLTYKQMMLL